MGKEVRWRARMEFDSKRRETLINMSSISAPLNSDAPYVMD